MTLSELLATVKDEQARGVRGKATHQFLIVVFAKLGQLAVYEVGSGDHGDLVQRSAAKVWKLLPGFEYRGPEAFTAWLREIVRFEALALRRKGARRGVLAEALEREPAGAVGPSPTSVVFRDQKLQAIEEAKKLLTPMQREALAYDDTRELAKAKGIPLVTARRRKRRAERRLRVLLRRRTTWRVMIPTSS